jgi:8-oxo-dGTP pyrophosphatase MutT (NUDIX family)
VDSETLLRRIELGLRAPLPGIPAQLVMAPDPRPGQQAYFEVEQTSLKAGVLLLLYEKRNVLHLLFTLRTDNVLHHRGQISFPGGEQHPGESIEATALRETEEELGLDLAAVSILGKLTPLYIPPSNYCVYPTVALLPGEPVFRPQPDEVAEVIEVPLVHLTEAANLKRETRNLSGCDAVVPFYEFARHKIWGATAMILAEFLAVVEAGGIC